MNPAGLWSRFRSIISTYLSILGPRFVVLVWVGAIAGCIWVFGPRLSYKGFAPLAPERNRIIAIAILVGLTLVWMLFSWWRKRRADAAMADDIADSPERRAAAEKNEELTELRERLRTAMSTMRKVARRRFGYTYEFPWYLMMGAPGAGKTTFVTKSGLKLPLGDVLKAEPIQGVGGTRNCNWWFTDRAILIDTAGRYTTQESGHERDSAGFLGFLSMLRSRRRVQPINGVILTVSLADLLERSADECLQEARSIRQRLAEIEESLGARIPIYVVLSKADRLAGFTQFFESFGAQSRSQVWGITFPVDANKTPGSLPDIFSTEYRGLLERLDAMLLERLQQETDIQRRGRIFRFPAQVAEVHDTLRELITQLSSGSSTIYEPFIRGIYFTSATQDENAVVEGTAPKQSMFSKPTYFIDRLMSEVILGEAALVGRDTRVSRRRRILMGASYGLAFLVSMLLLGSWAVGYKHTNQALAQVDDGLERYREVVHNIPVREIADTDFLRLLPALNTLGSVPEAFETTEETLPIHKIALGMDRGNQIADQHSDAYAEALGAILLPRYMVALQDRLKAEEISEAEAFETLKHYLSLAGLGPIDRDALLAQSERIFEELYPGSGRVSTRKTLQEHLAAMLDKGNLPIMTIDDNLVAEIRERIRNRVPAQRVMDLLATRPAARELPNWSITTAIGPAASKAFMRASGAPLDAGLDGLLTEEGYRNVVLPQITILAGVAASEDWVRGPGAVMRATPSEIAADTMELYWTEFEKSWKAMISDVTIRQVTNLNDAADLVSLIQSPANPVGRLAEEIAAHTELAGMSDEIADMASDLPFDPLASPDPYGPLRRALEMKGEGEDAVNALTPLQPILDTLSQQLGRATASDMRAVEVFAAGSQLSSAAQDLAAAGQTLPNPVDTWVVGLAGQIASAGVVQARKSVDELWRATGAEECRRAVEGRYPFAKAAESEIPIADFTHLFGPQGLFDTFFNENLADFVDTKTDPWSWKGGLRTVGEDSEGLAQFQRAEMIRKAFFATGGAAPRIEIAAELRQLDPSSSMVTLQFGGFKWASSRDRLDHRTLVWPSEGSQLANVEILPRGRLRALYVNSAWAPFRLFELGEITVVTDNQFDVTFRVDAQEATLRITSGSVNNPFRLEELGAFRCPDHL